MASNGEIEKLERRWQENPLGLTFAPLAEAYRKAGDTARALELLETGLTQHPNYVPAHIVRGRCHLDASSPAEAEYAFQRVTELDPENVIALKGLADVSERAGRLPEAIERLERLLDVDRNNEEARGQLDRLRELQANPPREAPSLAIVVEEAVVAPLPPAAETPSREEPPAPEGAGEAAWTVLSEDGDDLDSIDDVESILDQPPAVTEEPAPPLTDEPIWGHASMVTGSEGPLSDVTVFETVELTASGSQEYQTLGDAETLRPSESRLADVVQGTDIRPPEPPGRDLAPPAGPAAGPTAEVEPEKEEEFVPAAGASSEEEARSAEPAGGEPEEPAAPAEPELVVTETMADIFLRQGHRELALAVYTQLILREPDNERVAAAAAQLRTELHPVEEKPAPPPAAPEPPPEPVRRYSAAETGGRSVSQLFGQLLAAGRPTAATPVHPPAFEPPPRQPAGEPTRPAEENLSLSAVFGDDASLARPAEAPRRETPREPSFDEFFGSAGGPASEVELPRTVPLESAAPAPAPEDLEQFNAWLRGLKR